MKAPSVSLTVEESQQAHTYATHPEIAALFYLLTNGIEWRLYQVGQPERPVFSWDHEQTENVRPVIENILSPSAFSRRAKLVEIDTRKPLAKGLNSTAIINGGHATYTRTRTGNYTFDQGLEKIDGFRSPVASGYARRTDQGTIEAGIAMLSTFSAADALRQNADNNILVFATTSEAISSDKDNPTIFTNLMKMDFQRGAQLPPMFGNSGGVVPASLSMAAFTQAVGYIEEGRFKGTFEVSMLAEVEQSASAGLVARIFAQQLNGIAVTSIGDFDLSIS